MAFGAETEGAADDVAFSKEQSWKIDFATAVVENSGFGGAVKVAAKVVATPQNFTTVVAATSGRDAVIIFLINSIYSAFTTKIY